MSDGRPDLQKYEEDQKRVLEDLASSLLSFDANLILGQRNDLLIFEDTVPTWRQNSIRQLPEFELRGLINILERKKEFQKHHSLGEDFQ